MAKTYIIAQVLKPQLTPGPYTFTIEIVNPCTDVTLRLGTQSGINKLVVSSANPSIQVEAEFDGADCALADIGTLRATIDNGDCISFVEKLKANPCSGIYARIISASPQNNTQEFFAEVGNGNQPFSYDWEVKTAGIAIISGQDERIVKIDRSDPKTFQLEVTVTDNNGCIDTKTITVPAIGSDQPTLNDKTFVRHCDSPVTSSRVYDLLVEGSDPDGTLDLSSVEIVTGPTNGAVSIDYAAGTVTYAGNVSATGTDYFELRIKDNSGQWSNVARVDIQHTPCIEGPAVSGEGAAATCGTQTNIAPTLPGDALPSTLEVVIEPLHGVAQALSDGTIDYTPDDNYEGIDILRYRVQDDDGQWSDLASITITVSGCCDNHNAGLSFACAEQALNYLISAVNSGSIGSVASDQIEVDTGGGYGVGSSGLLAKACVQSNDNYVSAPSSVFDVEATKLGGSSYEIEYTLADTVSQSVLEGILDYINECGGRVVQFGTVSLNTFPSTFRKASITNLQLTTNGFKFVYFATTDASYCSTEVDALVEDTHDLLALVTTPVTYSTIPQFATKCIALLTQKTIDFKRTITRNNGCGTVIMEYRVTIDTGDVDVCGNLSSAIISSQNPGNDVVIQNSFDGAQDVAGISKVEEIIVNSVNILTQEYLVPSQMAQLESAIDSWLASNGGGDAYVYFLSDPTRLYIQVEDTTKTFETFTTNAGSENFTVLS